jgi:hypothetical protein
MSNVSIEVLREVTNRIFDFIERDLKTKSVQLPHNYYWSVSDEVLYAMDSQPPQLDVGSLVDDFSFVAAASKDPSQAIPLVLMHIAPLLRALSRAVPSYRPPPDNKAQRE